jgi:hypothetical protein
VRKLLAFCLKAFPYTQPPFNLRPRQQIESNRRRTATMTTHTINTPTPPEISISPDGASLLLAFQNNYCEFAAAGGEIPPPGAPALAAIKQFVETKNAADLESCTFKHVAAFMSTGAKPSRLPVALTDFRLDLAQLTERRRAGATAADIAREVLARWSSAAPQ